ncbi:hypothetical protein CEXT_279591 [Caerostris extrusa]|uniref:Uncharacterized protein n=1 Tax=Caerostris extrusa TaxID=172846 RepID=A0AAV4X4K7_CAEEX|nr:hypothetical protein CEXT_279591 [Caerostris extrusa]
MHYHAICFAPRHLGNPFHLQNWRELFTFRSPIKTQARVESSPPHFARDLGGRRTGPSLVPAGRSKIRSNEIAVPSGLEYRDKSAVTVANYPSKKQGNVLHFHFLMILAELFNVGSSFPGIHFYSGKLKPLTPSVDTGAHSIEQNVR